MELFVLYVIFAITTSLTFLYEIGHPVITKGVVNKLNVAPSFVYYLTFFFLNCLIAPLIFLSCIIPSYGEKFREVLYTSLFETNK